MTLDAGLSTITTLTESYRDWAVTFAGTNVRDDEEQVGLRRESFCYDGVEVHWIHFGPWKLLPSTELEFKFVV